MKVYFEESGCGCDGKGNNTVGIKIYVKPGGGSAYHYNGLSELCYFSWVHPDKARVIESDDLPEELWYSITHGTDHADVPQYLSNYKWSVNDLIYTKVNKAKVEAYKKVVDALPSVKTIEDFKQIYPLIKESGTISTTIIDKLFGLMGIKHTEARNGEIGIAFAHDLTIYEQCIEKIFS